MSSKVTSSSTGVSGMIGSDSLKLSKINVDGAVKPSMTNSFSLVWVAT